MSDQAWLTAIAPGIRTDRKFVRRIRKVRTSRFG